MRRMNVIMINKIGQALYVVLRFITPLYVIALLCQPMLAHGATLAESSSSLERVKDLSVQAATAFTRKDTLSALRYLQEAAAIVNTLESGERRTIAGFEIKDAFFAAFEGKQITEDSARRQAVRLALQSLTKDDDVLPDAAPIERFNDSVFLLRLTRISRNGSSLDEAVEYYIWAIRLSRGLSGAMTPFEHEDINLFPRWVFQQGGVSGLTRIVKELPEELRFRTVCDMQADFSYGAFLPLRNFYLFDYHAGRLKPKPKRDQNTIEIPSPPTPDSPCVSYDCRKTLKIADDTELLIDVIAKIAGQGNTQNSNCFTPGWDSRLRGFIWKSYLAASEPEAADRKLDVWLRGIRNIPHPGYRAVALRSVAFDMERVGVSPELVKSLKSEAEEQDKLARSPAKSPLPVAAPTGVPEKK